MKKLTQRRRDAEDELLRIILTQVTAPSALFGEIHQQISASLRLCVFCLFGSLCHCDSLTPKRFKAGTRQIRWVAGVTHAVSLWFLFFGVMQKANYLDVPTAMPQVVGG